MTAGFIRIAILNERGEWPERSSDYHQPGFLLRTSVLVKQFFGGGVPLRGFSLQLTNESHAHVEYGLLLFRCQIRPPGQVLQLRIGGHRVLGLNRGHHLSCLLFNFRRSIFEHRFHLGSIFLWCDRSGCVLFSTPANDQYQGENSQNTI